MATNIIDYIEAHPVLVGGVALVAVVGIVILTSGGSSAQSTASYGGVNPQLAALYAQNSQTNAALQANSQTIAGQETIATTQAQYGVDIAQIQANTTTTTNNDALQAALAQLTEQQNTTDTGIAAQLQINQQNDAVSTTGIEAQLAGLESNNATSLGLAQTVAYEQTQIAGMTAGVETTLANDQTTLGLAQTAGAVNIADTASNNQVKVAGIGAQSSEVSSGIGAVAGLAGMAMAFL